MKQNTKTKIVVYMMAMFQMGNVGISPSLSKIAQEFPDAGDAAVQVLMTCPDIIIILSTLMASFLTTRVKWKWIATTGVGIYFVAGICGYLFSNSFPILFLWAAMLGLGMGMFTPTMATVVAHCFAGDERSEVLGFQSCFLNIGGIMLTVVGGLLSAISWRTNYLVYVPAIVVAMLTATMLPSNDLPTKEERRTAKPGGKVEPAVWRYCVLNFCFMLLYNVYPSNTAMLLHERGYVNSEVLAGIANGIGMFGGICASLFFPKLVKRIEEDTFTLAFILAGAGMCIGLIDSLATVILGAYLAGAGVSMGMPAGLRASSRKFRADRIERSNSVYLAVTFAGGFFSSIVVTPLAALFHPSVQCRLIVAAVLALVFAVAGLPIVRQAKRLPVLRD